MALIALSYHSPPMAPQLNAALTAILLGRPWPQGSTINTTRVVFLDNLGRQLLRVDNVYITARPDIELHLLGVCPRDNHRDDYIALYP